MTKLLISIILSISSIVFAQNKKALSLPEKDFEKFWTKFKDNYAFFELKGVDWDATYTQYRNQVTATTKQEELISILGKMVDPLQDGHITISKGDDVVYKNRKPSAFKLEFKGIEKELWKTSFTTFQNGKFAPVKGIGPIVNDEHLYYTSQNEGIGYVRITRCFGMLESLYSTKKELKDITFMLTLFDRIVNYFSETKGIIIDMRANGGGHSGDLLAKRFVMQEGITHYKSTKIKGDYQTFTPLRPIVITPNKGVRYTSLIVILTNDKTASSAENFTLALCRQPNVTTIGANTSGMLSDMFEGKLSRNVFFTLSNDSYYTVDRILLEDRGLLKLKCTILKMT
jgi:hypothetical protein